MEGHGGWSRHRKRISAHVELGGDEDTGCGWMGDGFIIIIVVIHTFRIHEDSSLKKDDNASDFTKERVNNAPPVNLGKD
jgi:hypothetical protein